MPSRLPLRHALVALALTAAPAAARAQAAPPPGTYLMVDGSGNHRHRTFLPGGLIYKGVPAGGPEAFGAAQARAGDPRELGTYTLNGNTLVIAWGGGQKPETKTFAMKGENVVLDGYTYAALRRYPKGHRLDGEYATHSYNSMTAAGGGTVTWGGSGTVVFRPDGTFDYGRSGMATATAGGAAASGSSRVSGRYEIAGNTVTFTFADGSVQRALVHPWKGEETASAPTSINLNGRTYMRR